MTAKYPTLAFNIQDVRDLMEEVSKYATNVEIRVRNAPKGNDAHRIEVVVSCARRDVCLGQSPWLKHSVYLSGGSCGSIDHAIHEALWKTHDDLTDHGNYGGRYTSLVPGWPKR